MMSGLNPSSLIYPHSHAPSFHRVLRYIEPEHVIIVMTLTAMDDLENQVGV